jgi:hypothetical protein
MSETDVKRESQIARIRALMAKTIANGCTEAEAQTAAEAVDRLLEAYELNLDEITVKAQELIHVEIKAFKHAVLYSGTGVGNFTDCKYWVDGTKLTLNFLGLGVDPEIAEYLMLLFKRAIDREVATYSLMNPEFAILHGEDRDQAVWAFQVGMANRLGGRLGDLKGKRDFTAKSKGTDLVIVKQPLIDAGMAALGIVLRGGFNGPSVRNMKAYSAGKAAAENVNINAGVGRSNSAAGRIGR